MKIGVLVGFNKNTDIDAEFRKVRDLELDSVQLCCWEHDLFTGEQRPDALMERDMVSRNPGSRYIVLTWDVDDRLIRTCSLCMDAGA